MDEKKEKEMEKDTEQQKRHSRRFMIFYVIALFSIALVLIFLSYLTQVRASRQVASISDELNEQTTVAQGAQQKMEDLQTQAQEQQKQLEAVNEQVKQLRELLGVGEDADLLEEVQQVMDERDALDLLAEAESEMAVDNVENAKIKFKQLTDQFSEERLNGTAENAVFTGHTAALYLALKEQLAAA